MGILTLARATHFSAEYILDLLLSQYFAGRSAGIIIINFGASSVGGFSEENSTSRDGSFIK